MLTLTTDQMAMVTWDKSLKQPVTPPLSWESSDLTVARVKPSTEDPLVGWVVAERPGNVFVTATDATGHTLKAEVRVIDPVAMLASLGAKVSPDLDAYAAGEIDASQVRCVLCGFAPCRCPEFGSPEYMALMDRLHGPRT
jgi:hypothetical protein